MTALAQDYKFRDISFRQEKYKETAIGAGEVEECTNGGSLYVNDQAVSFEADRNSRNVAFGFDQEIKTSSE
jgi:hypothetical protein